MDTMMRAMASQAAYVAGRVANCLTHKKKRSSKLIVFEKQIFTDLKLNDACTEQLAYQMSLAPREELRVTNLLKINVMYRLLIVDVLSTLNCIFLNF